MSNLNINSIKNNCRNGNLLKNNIRILKYFKNTQNNNSLSSSNFYIKKNNNSLISNLLNSSKKLVKNNLRYKSCTELPKSFQHYYPYNPSIIRTNYSAKNRTNPKTLSFISPYRAIESKGLKKNSKVSKKECKFKLHLKKFNFVNYNVNEYFFFDFIDGYNINSKIKEKYNNYMHNHPIENEEDISIFQLFDLIQNFKIDYNDNNFFNSSFKINKFKLKNNLSVKIKLSSLNLYFYKVKHNNKNHLNNKDYLFDNSNNSKSKGKNNIITKLKFPFSFLPFFYGINIIVFLKFLITIIAYDYEKNYFSIDFKNFMKNYKIYKKENLFFGENSYFQTFYNKNKEYFAYDWDIKNKNNKIHYVMKIILPQIKISINSDNKSISKFVYSIDTNKMIYLIKEKFKLWDFHILKFFTELKLFRQEINKIICNKLSDGIKNNHLKEESKSNNDKSIKFNYKRIFNFNKINININKVVQNENNYEFFFSQNINNKNESYFFQLQIPKIHIIFQESNQLIDKYFDLDIKRMSQINKLKKSFQIEDIIKYSMVIVDEKYQKSKKRKSCFENNGYKRNAKRSSTLKNNSISTKIKIKSVTSRTSIHNINSNINSNQFRFVIANKRSGSLRMRNKKEQSKKDIKLNLDKYIFNFDDDILKFIKPFEKNGNCFQKDNENSNGFKENLLQIKNNNDNNKNKLSVEIGKIKLIWKSNDLKEYEYYFEENEGRYLLENPPYVWENYIENKFSEFTI